MYSIKERAVSSLINLIKEKMNKTIFDTRENRHISHNVDTIRTAAVYFVKVRLPRIVRADLMKGVKDGILGHFKKDGLKPETFYDVRHSVEAVERRNKELEYTLNCLSRVYGGNR